MRSRVSRTGSATPRSGRRKVPIFVTPIQPVLTDDVPAGDAWVHEVKFDGYRMQVRVGSGTVSITSRQGRDWTHRFPFIVGAFESLPVRQLVTDGEVVSLSPNGLSDFGQLQAHLSAGRHDRIVYFAFDLLHLDGVDLTEGPLIERKRLLKDLLEEAGAQRIFYSEHFGDGRKLYRHACELGLEGIVSKKANAPYRSSTSWLKVKCVSGEELTIIGFVPGGRRTISALRLGRRNGEVFDYVGKVGTGFTNAVSEELRSRLDSMVIAKPSLSKKLRKPDTKWVRPVLKAKIAFRGITTDGKLRHPSFKGLKD
jgi:bifunctional non-homologous end joining protein LigD